MNAPRIVHSADVFPFAREGRDPWYRMDVSNDPAVTLAFGRNPDGSWDAGVIVGGEYEPGHLLKGRTVGSKVRLWHLADDLDGSAFDDVRAL